MTKPKAKHELKDRVGRTGVYDTIAPEIIHLKATTDLPNYQIAESLGINEATYYDWLNKRPEFSKAIKEADRKRLELMKQKAREMAFKKLTGYTVEEEKTEFISKTTIVKNADGTEEQISKPVPKSKTVTKKHIAASDTLIMYILNNTDEDNFRHKEHHDHTNKGEKFFDYGNLTTEELMARAKASEKLEKGDK